MKFSGRSIIGFADGSVSGEAFRARNPMTGEALRPVFYSTLTEEVEAAVRLAREAFSGYSRTPGRERAKFLRAIASNLEGISAEIIECCGFETALPEARLKGELARTTGQLRLFAQLVEDGSWTMARIDQADADRKPLPKPDIRCMLRPLGPVVVFGASNFPLAFSVAGGDTASALAAGNPVIVKAHPAHPGTGELAGNAIRDAVRLCGLPEGVFSLLFDAGNDVGVALVKHSLVKAGGFTGSRSGGTSLMKIAAARPEPIPFFAEMSSTNPVFILPGALRENAEKIATGLFGSFTLGAGQFCTKPGMVFLEKCEAAANFTAKLRDSVNSAATAHLLTAKIRSAYEAGIGARQTKPGVKVVAAANSHHDANGVGAALFETDAETFLRDSALSDEIFGPATLLIQHSNREELLRIARELEGHLTATLHGTEQDLCDFGDLIAILEQKAGRLIFNGFPTGVEVSHAMVHGGPFPATSDPRWTSVGTLAIYRFCRPVCYQGFPDASLPDELKDENPLEIWRIIDGEMSREPLQSRKLEAAS